MVRAISLVRQGLMSRSVDQEGPALSPIALRVTRLPRIVCSDEQPGTPAIREDKNDQ
jgi:hypothetical protein